MKNLFKYLKAPTAVLGIAIGLLFFFHDTLSLRLAEKAFAEQLLSISWKKAHLNLDSRTLSLLGVELSPVNERPDIENRVNLEQLSFEWQIEYPLSLRISNITLQGAELEMNATSAQSSFAWLTPYITKKIARSQSNRIINCTDCTFTWTQPLSPGTLSATGSNLNTVLLTYTGSVKLETATKIVASGQLAPNKEPLGQAVAFTTKGRLNGHPLSLSGTIKQAQNSEKNFNLRAASLSPTSILEGSLIPDISVESTADINIGASITSSDIDQPLTISDWQIAFSFTDSSSLRIKNTHPFLSTETQVDWQKGSLEIIWQKNQEHITSSMPTVAFNPEQLTGFILHTDSPKTEIHAGHQFTLDQLDTKLVHNAPYGWVAQHTHLKKLRIESTDEGQTDMALKIAETDIRKLRIHQESKKNHTPHWLAEGVVSSGISLELSHPQILNSLWSHWLKHSSPKSKLVAFKDFSALTETEIIQRNDADQISHRLTVQPFQLTGTSATQSYLLTVQSDQLNALTRSHSQKTDRNQEPPSPQARVMMTIDGEQCQFRSMIQAGQLGSLNEIYELLGPSLSEANLPIYLADVFKSELEEQNLIYLSESACNINQPLSILTTISQEAPRSLVEKSTEKIASLKPDYATHLINRFSASSTLSELMIGQLRFKPLSNQLAHNQSNELNKIIQRIKKLVAVSEQAQLRIESSANHSDLAAWKETQKEVLEANDGELFSVLARQRGLRLKKILLENGIEEDQLYLSRPKFNHENQEAFQVKIFL